MELLKQLEQAKASGLTKDEYFSLLQAELKLSEIKFQTRDFHQISEPSSIASNPSASFINIDDTSMKECEDAGYKQCEDTSYIKASLDGSELYQSFERLLATSIQQMRTEFREMRDAILARLDQDRSSMREQLNKTQNEVNLKLTKIDDEVNHIKTLLNTGLSTVGQEVHEAMTNTQLLCERTRVSQAGASHCDELIGSGRAGAVENKLNDLENHLKEIPEKLDGIKSYLADVTDISNAKFVTALEGKMIESTKMVENAMNQIKGEIFDVTEKEVQLLRDRIPNPFPPKKHYICDFYVPHFRDKIKSTAVVYSAPWHIEQLGSCVKGVAEFTPNAQMSVWIVHGRHPREVGLALKSTIKLDVSATIKDMRCILPDSTVGHTTWECNEAKIKDNSFWGELVGVLSCWDLMGKGYGQNEGYDKEALLLRFKIDVI